MVGVCPIAKRRKPSRTQALRFAEVLQPGEVVSFERGSQGPRDERPDVRRFISFDLSQSAMHMSLIDPKRKYA